MNHRARTSLLIAAAGVLVLIIAQTPAQAFWFGWRTNYRPVYGVYRPVAPAYAAQGTLAVGGCDPCGSVAQGYAMQPYAAQPYAMQPYAAQPYAAQPYTVNFAPRRWFRSSWMRVPVTRYRPVVVASPVTGATVTQLQPCNTYRWQLQRVPVVRYRPLYSWMPQRCAAPGAQSVFGTALGGCATCAPAAACATCAPAATTVPGTAPYYQPSTAVPLNPIPSTAPSTGVPADVAPSLRPSETQYPAQGSLSPGVAPYGSGVNHRSSVTPIPDPAADPRVEDDDIPALLGPRDRTASLRETHSWAVTPIHWSAPRRSTADVAPAPAAKRVEPERWDDSGWRSAR